MKLIFISNYFNHHQRFVSDALNARCEGYRFVATSKMREERRKLGYGEETLPAYVTDCSDGKIDDTVLRELEACDAVVIGSAPEEYIRKRQERRQLVFRYGERVYKTGYEWYKWPFRLLTFYKRYGRHKRTYLLCASAFTYADYAKHFSFIDKAYAWGYFPEAKTYEDVSALLERKKKASLLWVGRMLDWKHPEDAVEVAKRLRDDGLDFELTMIGVGEMEPRVRELLKQWRLEEHVHMLGAMKPECVREYMERSQIFLFTSDKREGWGAVLNEAMNSGCAVVASHAIGAVPSLVKDGENGAIYRFGDTDMLYEKVKELLEHPQKAVRFGENAYRTIVTEWNAEVAAERLVRLAERIAAGEAHPQLYESGPCSRAKIVKDNWY